MRAGAVPVHKGYAEQSLHTRKGSAWSEGMWLIILPDIAHTNGGASTMAVMLWWKPF